MLSYWQYSANDFQTLLSREELFDISDQINQAYAPDLSQESQCPEHNELSTISRQELLEISQNISLYYAPRILSSTRSLVMIPIDPENFHVYWNLNENPLSTPSQSSLDQDLKLRIYSHSKECRENAQARLVYEMPIQSAQSQQKITLNQAEKGAVYVASIGKHYSGNRFIGLLNSNNIYALHNSKDQDRKVGDPTANIDFSEEGSFSEAIKKPIKLTDKLQHHDLAKPKKSHFASSNFSGQGNKK